MTILRWLVESTQTQSAFESLEQPSVFLCAVEEDVYDGLKSEKRRRDWLLGRRTAKRLLRRVAAEVADREVALPSIIIAARPDGSPGARWETPDIALPPVTLSISHSREWAFCAVIPLADFPLGADIEAVEPRPQGFAADYFTEDERNLVDAAGDASRPLLETAIWSAKESAFKAIRAGLTVDTRSVSCLVEARTPVEAWLPFTLRWETPVSGLPALQGWWRTWSADGNDFVLTLAAADNVSLQAD